MTDPKIAREMHWRWIRGRMQFEASLIRHRTRLAVVGAYLTTCLIGNCETVQQAMLKASNAGSGDEFGSSIAISGDTIVIGAPYEDGGTGGVNAGPLAESDNSMPYCGAAYVFIRENGEWRQQAYLKASNPSPDDTFGTSVAIDGDTIVVGSPNESSDRSGVTPGAVFAPNELRRDSGAAYVFVRSEGVWSQQAYLKASNPGQSDEFGEAVAIEGDTIVVGAYGEDGSYWGVNPGPVAEADNNAPSSGAAYIFVRNGDYWSQQAYLKASNANMDDQFGRSVAVSGNTVLVGARLEDSNATGVNGNQSNNTQPDAGAAYVFVRSGSAWSQQAYLKAPHTDWYDLFAWSVSLSGNTAVCGAPGISVSDNLGARSGAAYVFVRSGNTWSLQKELVASNAQDDDNFGGSVSVSGDRIIVGALGEASNAAGLNPGSAPGSGQNNNSSFQAGAPYVFGRANNILESVVLRETAQHHSLGPIRNCCGDFRKHFYSLFPISKLHRCGFGCRVCIRRGHSLAAVAPVTLWDSHECRQRCGLR